MENTDLTESKAYARGRVMSILQAMFEYLIALLVQGAFLARISTSLGISDGLTGIISSIISLGCLFQLFSIFIRIGKKKTLVVIMSIVNQLLFAFLYAIPILDIDSSVKPAIFVTVIISAYIIYNVIQPKKIVWLMSLVSDRKRGKFTAVKEIISLIAGIIYPIIMGNVVDSYTQKGDLNGAFLICGCTMLSLTLLHTLTLVLSPEPDTSSHIDRKTDFGAVFKNKKVISVAILFVFWNIAHYLSFPFYGTFQVNDLEFSMTKAQILAALGSLSRIVFLPIFGAYADKKGFAKTLVFGFLFGIASFLSVVFANEKTGTVCFALYYIFFGIAMAIINSSCTNLVFDVSPMELRSDAFAITQCLSGSAGFVATLIASAILTFIAPLAQSMGIYPQQILSAISVIFTVICVIYLKHNFLNNKKD